jgi:Flp pilus assembly protein TadB
MDAMNPNHTARQEARQEAGAEIHKLAEEFELSDETAFRRGRIVRAVVSAAITAVYLILLLAGADWRAWGALWAVAIGLVWVEYALSIHRQRRQTARLRELAARWLRDGTDLNDGPAPPLTPE